MPKRLYAVTPTKLATWSACPRKFRFTYLQRLPKGGPWAHSSMGAAAHNALKQWWDEPIRLRTPAQAGELVRRGWANEGFRDTAQSHAWRTRTAQMVTAYAASMNPQRQPLGIERTVASPAMGMAVSGRVDRIDAGPPDAAGKESAVIVDYKTGRSMLSSDDARSSAALALYAVAAQRTLRRSCSRVELHHLPSGTKAVWDHSEESLARHVRRANDLADEAHAADEMWKAGLDVHAARVGLDAAGVIADAELDEVLPPRPSSMCGWCDYRRWCPAGREAAPGKLPWDGLAPSEPDLT